LTYRGGGEQICRKTKKTVTGLFTRGEKIEEESIDDTEPGQEDGFLSMKNFLESRAREQTEEARHPIEEIKIQLRITGVEFLDGDGKKKHENYVCVDITPVANLDLCSYINEEILRPPKQSSPQYAVQSEFYTSMRDAWEAVLNNETVTNLGVLPQDFGTLDDYRYNSGGSLGLITILSPFMVPLKIAHVIHTNYPHAHAIKIIGVPIINFETDNPVRRDWVQCTHRSITAHQRIEDRNAELLQRYNQLKDKSTWEDPSQDAVGGWPLKVDREGNVLVFGQPPAPIKMLFSNPTVGVKRNFEAWFSAVGGGETLPALASALMRSYLINTSDEHGDVFPEISHFLSDMRKADPILKFNTYFR
jgi:hypothetical protein